MLKKSIGYLLILAVIVAALSFGHVFYIVDSGNGTLFWNGDSAEIFLNLGTSGYRMSYIQYMWQMALEFFGEGREPSNKRYSSAVITINSEVRSYVFDNMRLSEYFATSRGILSGDQNTGILWKWDENHFERATAMEQRLLETVASHTPGPDYDNVDGWYKRCCFFTRGSDYTYLINLKAGHLSVLARRDRSNGLSVDIIRPDGTKDRIWELDGRSRKVSRSEYERVFRK